MSLFNIDEPQTGLPRRVAICPVPTSVPSNTSYALSYTGSNLTQIDKTTDGVTYRRTLAYTGSQLDTVTVWSIP